MDFRFSGFRDLVDFRLSRFSAFPILSFFVDFMFWGMQERIEIAEFKVYGKDANYRFFGFQALADFASGVVLGILIVSAFGLFQGPGPCPDSRTACTTVCGQRPVPRADLDQ